MTATAAASAYRRVLALVGQPATFIRVTGFAPHPVATQQATVNVMASGDVPDAATSSRTGYGSADIGSITQNSRTLIVLAQDLVDAGFPVPVRKNDKITLQGEELNVTAVDVNKRQYAGAVEVTVAGV